jgi:Ca2+-binding EF-hand superfamily protein
MRSSFFDCNNEDYDEILQTLSTNNEDQIDFAEFISAAYDHKRLFKEANLMAVFSILDREKSGYITKENFKTALSGGKND